MTDSSHPITRQHLWWATIAAVLFAAAAAVIAVPWFGPPSLSNADGAFTIAILLAAALVGWLSWLGVERYSGGHPILGGVAAGVFTGIFAHPLAWFLGPIVAQADLAGSSVFFLPLMAVWSLMLLVWFTVPLGIVAGVLTGVLRAVLSRDRSLGDADFT